MPSGIFISTVEASADLHAGHAVRSLARLAPGLAVRAVGGDRLRAAGAEVVLETQGRAAMGFTEVVRHLNFYRDLARRTGDEIARTRPAAVVLVDAGGYHLRLAGRLRARFPDLPILQYIAPKLWAWHESRIKALRRRIRETLCIFPFEEAWFRERGVAARYVGNPTFDQLRPHWERRMEWLRAGGRPGKGMFFSPWHTGLERTVAVFPGSRPQEIRRMWRCFSETIRLLQNQFDDLLFTVALAPGVDAHDLRRCAPIPGRTAFVEAEWSQRLLSGSVFALAKSGTTTLEAALLAVPMVVAYRAHAATAWLLRRTSLRELRHLSLPNILAGREVVPELLQERATPEALAGAAAPALGDSETYARIVRDLTGLRASFDGEPAGDRAARAILEHVN